MHAPKKVLFVCLGNICRSPMAEIILRSKAPADWEIDSCGIGNWHVGETPNAKTIRVCKERLGPESVAILHRARQLSKADFSNFDYVLCMDDSNFNDAQTKAVLARLGSYLPEDEDVFDPYHHDLSVFEACFDHISLCIEAFLASVNVNNL